jgi:hypothetical protein
LRVVLAGGNENGNWKFFPEKISGVNIDKDRFLLRIRNRFQFYNPRR